MSGSSDLYALLSSDAGVGALVSDRIYPIVVPNDKDLPAMAYRRSNTEYVNTITVGAVAADVSFDIICGAKTPLEAEQLADAVELVPGLTFLNRVDDFDPETEIYANVVTVQLLTQ